MKSILKTTKIQLNYEETFNSEENIKIRRELISELQKAMKPNYHPSTNQLTKWLNCLHKSRRSQLKLKNSGKSTEGNRRIHNNNRIHDVSMIEFSNVFPLLMLIFE
jgi:hypothetical protein